MSYIYLHMHRIYKHSTKIIHPIEPKQGADFSMETILESARKVRRVLTSNPAMVQKIACLILAVLLIMTICIFSASLSNMQDAYSSSRNELGERIYSNLYMMYSSYQGALQPGANVQDDILPRMQKYYTAAQTLDDAMAGCFGETYRVLTSTVKSSLNDAFDAYSGAYRMGKSTATAESSMNACMNSLESLLLTRFNAQGAVIPVE